MAIKVRVIDPPVLRVEFDLVGPGGVVLGPVSLDCVALSREDFDAEIAGDTMTFMLRVLRGWKGFDEPFSPDTLRALCSSYPAAAHQMVREYSRALFAVERKN